MSTRWSKMSTEDILEYMYGEDAEEILPIKIRPVKDHNEKSVKIDTSRLNDKTDEERVIDDIYKHECVQWLADNDISFDYFMKVIESEKMNSIIKYNFNQILISAKKEINFDIYKIILYIYESIGMLRKILLLIDDDVRMIIKEELAVKYKIKLKSGSIEELISIYKL